jgi:membrane protease YdiL (CAAX protease family)
MAAAGASALSAQLTRVELRQGEHVIFELCTKAQLEPSVWLNAFELALVELGSSPDLPLTVRVKLDAPRLETARRNTQGACVSLGGGEVARSGAYSVDAAWSEPQLDARILGAALAVRVLAYRPVQQAERTGWLLLAASVVSLLTTLLLRPPSAPKADEVAKPLLWLSALGVLALLVIIMQLPVQGAFATLGKGAALVMLQVAVPCVFATWGGAPSVLPCTPRGGALHAFAHALATCVLLWALARLALREIPATGEAPIQTFVAWPSGRLCFATLALVLPLGEEAFFRGLLYRALIVRTGRSWVAMVVSCSVFVALHAQQSWGNWGGLVAVAITGAVLTVSRRLSGSVLVPALAHVLYNAALSAPTL